jgi:hypothetical protein
MTRTAVSVRLIVGAPVAVADAAPRSGRGTLTAGGAS